MREKGILVPLIVRPDPAGSGYEIIAGRRRKAAGKWAGLDTVPAVIV
ncbi:MAG: ParB N-terminal domain-containing protein [Lachnospiraceae bacterium]|nr:ParB N-terminal domain-containing protein [Lachnospiraceae bacterium]